MSRWKWCWSWNNDYDDEEVHDAGNNVEDYSENDDEDDDEGYDDDDDDGTDLDVDDDVVEGPKRADIEKALERLGFTSGPVFDFHSDVLGASAPALNQEVAGDATKWEDLTLHNKSCECL